MYCIKSFWSTLSKAEDKSYGWGQVKIRKYFRAIGDGCFVKDICEVVIVFINTFSENMVSQSYRCIRRCLRIFCFQETKYNDQAKFSFHLIFVCTVQANILDMVYVLTALDYKDAHMQTLKFVLYIQYMQGRLGICIQCTDIGPMHPDKYQTNLNLNDCIK